jgi:hypothetical protein
MQKRLTAEIAEYAEKTYKAILGVLCELGGKCL